MGRALTRGDRAVLSRRRFISLAVGSTALGVFALSSLGCATGSSPSEGNSADTTSSAGTADAANSGARFDSACFTVGSALGEPYERALAEVRKTAPDAVLFALRTATVVLPGETVTWDYLFASQQNLRYYIAFTGTATSVSELGECTMKFAEWEHVPAVDAIKVDAPAAWESVCEAAADMGAPSNLYVYLILYSEESDTAASAYSYADEPLTWYFEFSVNEGEATQEASGAQGADADAAQGAPAAAEDEGSAAGETTTTPLVVYAVNAETGETSCVVG